MTFIVDAVLIGRVAPFGDKTSAIDKRWVDGVRKIAALGIVGDEQADLSVHGGIDKAIHHYPHDHYQFWTETLGPLAVLAKPGAFGENISTIGLTETHVCIGDRFRLGTSLVEVSQGRQPCWKQGHRLAASHVVSTMIRTTKCGWYYRVIEAGEVKSGDSITLCARPHAGWTVARVIALLIAGDGKHDPAEVQPLVAMDALSFNWRSRARRIVEQQ